MSRCVMLRDVLCFIFLFYDVARSGAYVNSSFSRPSRKYDQPERYSRRPSVPRSNLHVLFPTASSLGAVYIARKMRTQIQPRSYHDFYDYTICEGPKSEYVDTAGGFQVFPYFLCPDDPNQMFKRYCCRESRNGEGVCCSYDELHGLYRGINKWAILGGCLAVFGIVVMAALLIYCCCFAKRRQKPAAPSAQGPSVTEPIKPPVGPQPIGFIPYAFASHPMAGPQVPMCGPPSPYPTPVQPGMAWMTASTAPCSSWQAKQLYESVPPPPYPRAETSSEIKDKPPYPA